jgi:hypothetical protein
MKKSISAFILLASISTIFFSASWALALNEKCGEADTKIQKACRNVKYADLPRAVTDLMAGCECDVKTGSVYDEGYALDLNEDGMDEYAFNCYEVPHGPGRMKIFGKTADKWKVLLEYMPGYSDGVTPCYGFIILRTSTNGYHDICVDNVTFKFKKDKYEK